MKYLGIDYGKRKIGLAVSDGLIAEVFKIIDSTSLVDSVQKVGQVIKTESVETIVIGMPESGESAQITKKFIQEIKKSGIEIIQVPETLSSQDAGRLMREMGVKKSALSKEDAIAASIILQDYLDSLAK